MKLLCKLFGHSWKRLEDTSADDAALKGWWFENYICKRCGVHGRDLVASQEG